MAKTLKLEEKAKILEGLEKGASVTSLSKQHGVAKSTICSIKNKKDVILNHIKRATELPKPEKEKIRIQTKNRKHWSENAEKLLIELWAQRYVSLKETRKTRPIYIDIVNQLLAANDDYEFDVEEVKCKIHNLASRYRAEKKNIDATGELSSWNLFDDIHQIVESTKIYNEDEESTGRTETETNFTFIENSMDEFLSEEDIQLKDMKHEKILVAHEEDFLSNERNYYPFKDSATQTNFKINAKRFKNDDSDDADESNCLQKLANTVNDVVKFIVKTDSEKSRNDSFLKVLDSYLMQLPDNAQDKLKIEILNTVFNRVNEVNYENNQYAKRD